MWLAIQLGKESLAGERGLNRHTRNAQKVLQFFQGETLKLRKAAIKAVLCNLSVILLYICGFELHGCIPIFSSCNRKDRHWGFSDDCSYRIEAWFAENRRHGENKAFDSKNKRLFLLWSLCQVVEFYLSVTETFFDTKWVTSTKLLTCFVFPLHSGFLSWDLVAWLAEILNAQPQAAELIKRFIAPSALKMNS